MIDHAARIELICILMVGALCVQGIVVMVVMVGWVGGQVMAGAAAGQIRNSGQIGAQI